MFGRLDGGFQRVDLYGSSIVERIQEVEVSLVARRLPIVDLGLSWACEGPADG